MRTLISAAALVVVAGGAGIAAAQSCPPGAVDRVESLVRAERHVDAHLVAEVLATLCPEDPELPKLRVLDAVALLRLDEDVRGRELLDGLDGEEARVVLAWSHARRRDRDGFRRAAEKLSAEARGRLEAYAAIGGKRFARVTTDPYLVAKHEEYLDARTRSPGFAGLLSAVLPGAGQAYAGSWQGAAVSFVLNAVLICATVELIREEHYFTAGATGLAASIFYVGNILNAADLAARANDVASEPHRREIERRLIPEAR